MLNMGYDYEIIQRQKGLGVQHISCENSNKTFFTRSVAILSKGFIYDYIKVVLK